MDQLWSTGEELTYSRVDERGEQRMIIPVMQHLGGVRVIIVAESMVDELLAPGGWTRVAEEDGATVLVPEVWSE